MHGHCCRRSTNPEPLQRFGYKVPVHTLSETLSFKLYIVLDIATYLDHHQYLHGPNIFQSPFNRRSHFQMITYVPRCRRGVWNVVSCIAMPSEHLFLPNVPKGFHILTLLHSRDPRCGTNSEKTSGKTRLRKLKRTISAQAYMFWTL